MEALFSQASAQWGLGVGLLIVAVVILWRMHVRQMAEEKARSEKEIAEIKIERDLFRDRWLKAIDTAEVGDEAAHRLAGRRRRPGGS